MSALPVSESEKTKRHKTDIAIIAGRRPVLVTGCAGILLAQGCKPQKIR